MSIRRVVQFLHPGPEHGADPGSWHGSLGRKDWNRGKHKRKFLLADGSWTRIPEQAPTTGSFTFWGEWEPQSQVRRLIPNTELHPKYLHLPQLNLEVLGDLPQRTEQSCNTGLACGDTEGFQNTDPLVFGDQFLFVFCQQKVKKTLRLLSNGDIILFGSGGRKTETFALDAVFVVGTHAPVQRDGMLPNWESDFHRRITMDLIEIPECGLRLYGAEMWSSGKPFSFAPCRPAEPQPIGFSRPVIRPIGPLASLIGPTLTGLQNKKLGSRPRASSLGCCSPTSFGS